MINLQLWQAIKPFHVHVDYDINLNRLKGAILNPNIPYEPEFDGFFNNLFGSPVKFIEKCCKKANALKEKFSGNDKLDDIFSKLG